MQITIKARFTDRILVTGDYESIKDAVEKNRANLYGASLEGANLYRANLYRANLDRANLEGAKGYRDSHSFFLGVARLLQVDTFTDVEWSAIAQITIYTLCWDSIKKRFPDVMGHIFDVMADKGFTEWRDYWKN